MLAKMRCYFRNRHEPSRHPLGGFRCSECGTAGADLQDMGFDGYVSLMRTVFSRDPVVETTRTNLWEPQRSRPVPFPSRRAASDLREASRNTLSSESLAKGA
jgi:hypothetical protein